MDETGYKNRSRSDVVGKTKSRELAFSFLRLGTNAFGGPAAHIAMKEVTMVKRRINSRYHIEIIAARSYHFLCYLVIRQ